MLEGEGKTVRVIAGSFLGATAPVQTCSELFYADAELAAGYLYSESVIQDGAQIASIAPCAGTDSAIRVHLIGPAPDLAPLQRLGTLNSSCGLCGKSSQDVLSTLVTARTVQGTGCIESAVLRTLPLSLRAAQPVIVAELGDRHPYAQQVTNTLAGRLGGSETLVERLALRGWLVAGSTALYGATHTHTLQCVANEAYLLAALGRVDEAIAGFERAIDGLVAGPWPGQAANLLPPLARLWALQGAPERTAARERLVLAHAPGSRWTVREVFFGRAPEVAARYAARVLEHAAVHFPGLREAVLAGRGGPAIALAGGEASSAAAFMAGTITPFVRGPEPRPLCATLGAWETFDRRRSCRAPWPCTRPASTPRPTPCTARSSTRCPSTGTRCTWPACSPTRPASRSARWR